ncbi:hypothetical protein [Chryseobacterium sp. 3008163]|uniref:hypothetical protein n=1 Tax=Chryseobacterium sp. 3008163 TaxID=2478663 RepID=UPI000F0CC8AD|nr:hypothetical protein [Chryseobacterium sp. 3008163]AYN00316.1 hypothetical protein EAG08_08280 [Chryseobacterium sp. 3008163]
MNTSQKISTLFFKNQIHFLKENFVIKDENLFKKFSSAVERFCYFVFEIDKMIDGDYNFADQYQTNDNKIYHMMKNHQESIKLLVDIFPSTHQFWEDLDKTNYRYYQILLKENFENNQKSVYTIKDFEEYADSKHCLAYIPIIGLNYLFESKIDAEETNTIFKKIFLGMQMNDDLEDFNSDLLTAQWTYAHSRVEEFMKENNLIENNELDKYKERVLYVSGIGEELMSFAKENFISAKKLSNKNGFKKLESWLDETLDVINQNEELILKLTSN